VRKLPGVDADVALLPLHGHTRGHSGVVVGTGDRWLVHAGDAYFHHDELVAGKRAPFGLSLFQNAIQTSGRQRHASQAALRRLHADHRDVSIFSAHDPAELDTFVSN
jgi:glyoxylase-like metal-dependent hydrolase (beta-lactamase superfamily II)